MSHEGDRWTILRVLGWTGGRLAEHGVEAPRLEAEVLLAHCLGVDRVRLYMEHDKPLGRAELAGYRQAIRRRLADEPLAYITGVREFWSLELAVDRSVLIPRPETELLVELALEQARGRSPLTIVDVGTGSGAVAVALASELPGATILATEIEPEALEVARRNILRHGLEVELRQGDLLAAVPAERSLDLVVANPPYIRTAELAGLQPEIAREPVAALDGGADGLAVIRRLVSQAAERLGAGGGLLLEIGHDQGPQVAELLRARGFARVEVRQDLGARDRVVSGVRRP